MAYSCRTLLHFYKQLSMFWLNNIMMAINCTFDNKKLGIILSSQLKFLIDISRGKANVTIKYSNIGGKKKKPRQNEAIFIYKPSFSSA